MAIVTYGYYMSVYMGAAIAETDFPAYEARAEDVVCAMTHWKVSANTISDFPEQIQTLVKKAICAQTEYFVVAGLDAVVDGTENGFTVGKVTVQGKSSARESGAGVMSAKLSPLVQMYLEQTGLMNPQVPTAPDMPILGWW